MLELRIRRSQSNFSTVYIFVSCGEKYSYRDFLIGQVGFGSCSILRAQPVYAMASSKSFFFGVFSIFELGGKTKHLMTGPSGNSEFCFPETLRRRRGED